MSRDSPVALRNSAPERFAYFRRNENIEQGSILMSHVGKPARVLAFLEQLSRKVESNSLASTARYSGQTDWGFRIKVCLAKASG
jgi:hypothetical protein